MSYVKENLMPNERIVAEGKIHWFVFVPCGIAFFLGFGMSHGQSAPLGKFLTFIGIILFLKAFIFYMTTELAVTTKRVIAKFGFISRKTIELNHSKVESFNVDQSIMGRILGFGTIEVNGTGGIKTPIPSIIDPLEFRKNAIREIEKE
jgi:uncharacterized membrane protein YdbT with pleckstrin-like domain